MNTTEIQNPNSNSTTVSPGRCDKCGRELKGTTYIYGGYQLCIFCYQEAADEQAR